MAKFDGGEWSYSIAAPHVQRSLRHYVEGGPELQMRLYIGGNLYDTEARDYGKRLADWLNGPVELVNTIQTLRRQKLELERVNHEQRLQIKRLEIALDRLNPDGHPL